MGELLHDALRRDGVVLYQRPEIRVGHKKHYTYGSTSPNGFSTPDPMPGSGSRGLHCLDAWFTV
jgi:hypothetical protein